jgi:hypothetical protein
MVILPTLPPTLRWDGARTKQQSSKGNGKGDGWGDEGELKRQRGRGFREGGQRRRTEKEHREGGQRRRTETTILASAYFNKALLVFSSFVFAQ